MDPITLALAGMEAVQKTVAKGDDSITTSKGAE
jgi:hypothetical protein